ncbi:MAG TPA: nucleotidyltransferase domain-containing protein [archaeon]|nr:nucleotidyltransferase domain-containing protein [archaeon]
MKKLINKVVDDIKKIGKVNAVFLFGSHATGTNKPYSDIDICVVAEGLTEEERIEILTNSSEKLDVSLFSDLSLLIQYRVLKDGKVLFNRDWLKLHRMKVKTVTEYLDFKHLLDRHVEYTLNS